MLSRCKGIVFDVGGVFRDSRYLMHSCFQQSFAKHNIQLEFDRDEVYQLRGMETFNNLKNACKALYVTKGKDLNKFLNDPNGEDQLNNLIKQHKIDETLITNISLDFKTLFALPENKDKIILMPGTEEGLKKLKEKGFQLGLLSNSTMKALERDLGHLFHFFQFTIDEAKKPDTKVYLEALKNLGLSPTDTAYVGDAVSDVTMAHKAGSISVALLSGMGTESQLKAANPKFIFKDFVEFADAATKE